MAGGGSLKCLCMIMGEGEGGWPCDDKQISFLQRFLPAILLKIIMFFMPGFSLIYINVNICSDSVIFLRNLV